MPDDLYAQLLARSNREIHTLAEKLRDNLKDYEVIEPLLHATARNECRMARVKYEAYLAAGFSEQEALALVVANK